MDFSVVEITSGQIQTAYMMTVESGINEIICTFPDIVSHAEHTERVECATSDYGTTQHAIRFGVLW